MNLLRGAKVHKVRSMQLTAAPSRLSTRQVDYKEARRAAAEHMRAHPDDFRPYLTAEDVGDADDAALSSRKYAEYCDRIEHTSTWGGQTEVRRSLESLRAAI